VSRLPPAVLGLLVSGLFVACAGPRPAVERVETIPQGDGRLRVVVTLQNQNSGDGQVILTVTVRERASGVVVGREERPVDLRPRERVTLALDMVLSGSGGSEVIAEAEARYPPS